jgi:hypothetical protein
MIAHKILNKTLLDRTVLNKTMPCRLLSTLVLGLALSSIAAAQQLPIAMEYTQGGITTAIPNASVLTLAASLGQSQTLQIRATYTGTGSVTVSELPSVSGSTAFSATISQALPITLTPGQSFFFTLRFSPVKADADAAQLVVPFAETPASTISPITLSLRGVTAAIVVSYASPADNNVIPLKDGDTIPFPETLAGNSSPATLNFTNVGTSPGQVTKISVSGAAFRLQNLPLLPATLTAGQNLAVQVVFRPTAAGSNTGTVSVETSGGTTATYTLTGSATAPLLTYEVGTPPVAVTPNGTITLPAVDVGQSGTTLIRVSNKGTGATTISSINMVGQGFQVTSAPLLPQTLLPNTSMVFTVSFTPVRTGAHTATLLVNTDVFNVTANGSGSALTYSYVSGTTTVSLNPPNTSIIFSPVRITESAQVGLDIKNTSASSVTILNLGVGQTNSPFSITTPLTLPLTITANATLRVNIKFEPTVLGFATGTLIVDSATLNLTGSGTQPPALPAYTLSGPNGTVAPLTQPTVGLTLAAPYPVALAGTLTLTSSGTLPPDPAVQFATGGKTVAFRIPANSTAAIFGAQGTQIGLQTGTVAGTTTLTPSFATQAGSVDLTPGTPTSSQFTVSPGAPSLISVQVVNASTTGFSIQVTGYATTRTLTSMNIQLTTASGFTMPTSQFTLDLKNVAAAWFQSTASQAFGGQFRVTVPFNLQLPTVTQQSLSAISAIAVTVSNESGASATLTARTQ